MNILRAAPDGASAQVSTEPGQLHNAQLVHRRSWPTKANGRSAVFEFIESFYDRQRRHSALGYLSPERFEDTQ